MPDHVRDVAQANSTTLTRRADDAVAADPSGRLARFRGVAGGCVAATNVTAAKVKAFDELGELVPARELLAYELGLPADDPHLEAEFERRQGRWYAGRSAFESMWHEGERALYSALVLSGLGLPKYGDYTLVFDPDRAADEACFPGNSAERYHSGRAFDETLCRTDATPWTQRADMLAIKHAPVLPADVGRWPTMACSPGDFSELVHIGPVDLDSVAEIRVDSDAHRAWMDLVIRRADPGEAALMSDAEKTAADTLVLLYQWARDHGSRMVDV